MFDKNKIASKGGMHLNGGRKFNYFSGHLYYDGTHIGEFIKGREERTPVHRVTLNGSDKKYNLPEDRNQLLKDIEELVNAA